MSRRNETVVLLAAGALVLALIAVNVMAAQGRFDSPGGGRDAAARPTTGEDSTTREPTVTEPEEEEPATTAAETTVPDTTVATTTAPPPAPRLVLRAARGECYLSVRRGSVSGEVLYDGILAQGGSLDFTGARTWLRIGASTNLDATLDGEPLELPPGTVDVVVTRAGVQPA